MQASSPPITAVLITKASHFLNELMFLTSEAAFAMSCSYFIYFPQCPYTFITGLWTLHILERHSIYNLTVCIFHAGMALWVLEIMMSSWATEVGFIVFVIQEGYGCGREIRRDARRATLGMRHEHIGAGMHAVDKQSELRTQATKSITPFYQRDAVCLETMARCVHRENAPCALG